MAFKGMEGELTAPLLVRKILARKEAHEAELSSERRGHRRLVVPAVAMADAEEWGDAKEEKKEMSHRAHPLSAPSCIFEVECQFDAGSRVDDSEVENPADQNGALHIIYNFYCNLFTASQKLCRGGLTYAMKSRCRTCLCFGELVGMLRDFDVMPKLITRVSWCRIV